MKRWRSFGMILVVLAVVGVGFIPSSSTPTVQAANCYTNPTDVYQATPIYDNQGRYGIIGYVWLRWSASCGTNWSKVASTGIATLTGWLEKKYDTTRYVELTVPGTNQMYTDSMYGAGIWIRACGRIVFSNGVTGKNCTQYG